MEVFRGNSASGTAPSAASTPQGLQLVGRSSPRVTTAQRPACSGRRKGPHQRTRTSEAGGRKGITNHPTGRTRYRGPVTRPPRRSCCRRPARATSGQRDGSAMPEGRQFWIPGPTIATAQGVRSVSHPLRRRPVPANAQFRWGVATIWDDRAYEGRPPNPPRKKW